jgi:hypothetical protein
VGRQLPAFALHGDLHDLAQRTLIAVLRDRTTCPEHAWTGPEVRLLGGNGNGSVGVWLPERKTVVLAGGLTRARESLVASIAISGHADSLAPVSAASTRPPVARRRRSIRREITIQASAEHFADRNGASHSAFAVDRLHFRTADTTSSAPNKLIRAPQVNREMCRR